MKVREVVVLTEIADDVAYVVAVLPMRRDPRWIRTHLEGRS